MYFTPTLHSVCCINVKGKTGVRSAFAAETAFSDQCLEGKKKINKKKFLPTKPKEKKPHIFGNKR